MKPRQMVSLELDDEDKLDAIMPIAMPEKPDYPYGTRISLDEKTLAKLKINPQDLQQGALVHLHAIAMVTCVTTRDDGTRSGCVELQIQNMCIESEDEENQEVDQAERRRSPLHDNARS